MWLVPLWKSVFPRPPWSQMLHYQRPQNPPLKDWCVILISWKISWNFHYLWIVKYNKNSPVNISAVFLFSLPGSLLQFPCLQFLLLSSFSEKKEQILMDIQRFSFFSLLAWSGSGGSQKPAERWPEASSVTLLRSSWHAVTCFLSGIIHTSSDFAPGSQEQGTVHLSAALPMWGGGWAGEQAQGKRVKMCQHKENFSPRKVWCKTIGSTRDGLGAGQSCPR